MQNVMYWLSWIAHTLRFLRSGNIVRAANYLACCSDNPESAEDAWGMRRMFGHPELVPHHAELWAEMRPMILEEYQAELAHRLRTYGWAI
jgi:hypothetical protein